MYACIPVYIGMKYDYMRECTTEENIRLIYFTIGIAFS